MRPAPQLAFLAAASLLLPYIAARGQAAPGITHITVDATASRHPISPLIYGVNFAPARVLADLNAPVNRSGGDNVSLYNWQLNARNAGRDWFFESMPCSNDIFEQLGDGFVDLTRQGGSRSMLGIPMTGWVAKLGPNRSRLASYSITKYGLQHSTDVHGMTEAGDGLTLDGKFILNNDPHDAAIPDTLDRESSWVRHLVDRWKRADKGGVAYYQLDNEPSRWHDIHRDVQPVGLHASELAAKTIAYGRMIKSIDPSAKVLAPEEWGWTGYFDSGFDQQLRELNDKQTLPDRKTQTGGMDLLPWLMQQWKAAGKPVDIVSVHFYPQGGEYKEQDDLSERMQLLRNRSTRLLWDRNYKDTSWMNDTIALIPRLRDWVDRYYVAGTPVAITEYSWGAEKSMNGATAQADILGIFGREGLYMATRWIAPAEGSPVYLSMKLFRNYDAKRSAFGDTSVAATTPDADVVSAFAATRSNDGALTVVVVNKQLHEAAPIDLALSHFAPSGTFETITLADGQLHTLAPAPYRNGNAQSVLPPQSVSMLVFHPNVH
jgi:hypothetical protein